MHFIFLNILIIANYIPFIITHILVFFFFTFSAPLLKNCSINAVRLPRENEMFGKNVKMYQNIYLRWEDLHFNHQLTEKRQLINGKTKRSNETKKIGFWFIKSSIYRFFFFPVKVGRWCLPTQISFLCVDMSHCVFFIFFLPFLSFMFGQQWIRPDIERFYSTPEWKKRVRNNKLHFSEQITFFCWSRMKNIMKGGTTVIWFVWCFVTR